MNMALQRMAGNRAKKGPTGVTIKGASLDVRVLDNKRFPCGKLYYE